MKVDLPLSLEALLVCAYADGYLSDDERAHDHGCDMEGNVWDPEQAKPCAIHDGEAVLHSVVDRATTSYLNVLLNAKNQGQPVVISRADGEFCGLLRQDCDDLWGRLRLNVLLQAQLLLAKALKQEVQSCCSHCKCMCWTMV